MILCSLRSNYRVEAKLFHDSDETVTIEWYDAPPGAKVFPHPHMFMPLTWMRQPWEVTGLGEVYGAPRPFTVSHTPPSITGQGWYGDPEKFLNGTSFDPSKRRTERDRFGRVAACFGQEMEPVHMTGDTSQAFPCLPPSAAPSWSTGSTHAGFSAPPRKVGIVQGGSLVCEGGTSLPGKRIKRTQASFACASVWFVGGTDPAYGAAPGRPAVISPGDLDCVGGGPPAYSTGGRHPAVAVGGTVLCTGQTGTPFSSGGTPAGCNLLWDPGTHVNIDVEYPVSYVGNFKLSAKITPTVLASEGPELFVWYGSNQAVFDYNKGSNSWRLYFIVSGGLTILQTVPATLTMGVELNLEFKRTVNTWTCTKDGTVLMTGSFVVPGAITKVHVGNWYTGDSGSFRQVCMGSF